MMGFFKAKTVFMRQASATVPSCSIGFIVNVVAKETSFVVCV
jgi:hypothetical protein